jgi:hypothetical protein
MVFINPQSMAVEQTLEVERMDFEPQQRRNPPDHFAHAGGRTCTKCDRVIRDGQPARRRGESGWVHDVCPE